MIKHINNLEEFKKETANGKALVDFFATWCGPCRQVGPILEDLDADPSFDVQIIKIDVDEAEELAAAFGIQNIPTFFLFENGKAVKKQIGFMRKDQFLEFVK